jgi:hypothetical protein
MDVKAFWDNLPKKEGDLRDAKDVLLDAIGSRKEEIKKYYELKDKVDELKNEHERLKTDIQPVLSLVQIKDPSLHDLDSILRDANSREELFKLIDEYKADLAKFAAMTDERAGALSESRKNKKR